MTAQSVLESLLLNHYIKKRQDGRSFRGVLDPAYPGKEKFMEKTKSTQEEKTPVYYTYKDRVFRMLFKDRKRLLELYNALNDTAYVNEDELTVNTLENAIFMKMKNDVSFIIDSDMCLYEHQSGYCPNMPLRGLLYFADLYKKWCRDVDLSGRKKVLIPAPNYIVFYNGTEKKEEEFEQKLSDAFEQGRKGCMELTVRTININYDCNKELLSKCKTLSDYAYFISRIRENLEKMSLDEAVKEAVEYCIENGILKEFLMEQKAEVIAMSIYEYNEEYIRKTLLEEGREIGYAKGKTEGKAEMLVVSIRRLMKELDMDQEQICHMLGVSMEEYQQAEKLLNEVRNS